MRIRYILVHFLIRQYIQQTSTDSSFLLNFPQPPRSPHISISPISPHKHLIVRRRLINSVVAALTSALRDKSRGARDLLEGDARVIRAAEPVEAPVAPFFQGLGEAVAGLARRNAAVPLAPPVRRRAVLVCAGVEDAYAATGDL